jgi:hypothetical protein
LFLPPVLYCQAQAAKEIQQLQEKLEAAKAWIMNAEGCSILHAFFSGTGFYSWILCNLIALVASCCLYMFIVCALLIHTGWITRLIELVLSGTIP